MNAIVNVTPFVDDLFNNSDLSEGFSNSSDLFNATSAPSAAGPAGHSARGMFGVIVKVVYAIGIIGNAAAIVALRTGERRVRNRKHLLLLTSLAANDLVALVGMMCALVVGDHAPGVKETRLFCASRVILRIFGIGSVCIAVTMALERYLALTRPFLYQKDFVFQSSEWHCNCSGLAFMYMHCFVKRQVTYWVIRTALLVSWFWAAVLTCAPVLGLGLYYEEAGGGGRCVRYRNAVSTTDFIYAVFYVVFGTLLCLVLVYCNLAVIRALYAISAPRAGGGAGGAPVVRRVSRSSCRQRERSLPGGGGCGAAALHHNAATAEEVAFSRLMATLSVLFMICWLPQMVTSALYLALGPAQWARLAPLAHASDVLMLLNYVLDPVLYVLLRRRRPLAALCHSVAGCFKRGHKASTESMSLKTSCCQQDTVVVSDADGGGAPAEMRPLQLRAPPHKHLPTATLLKIDD